MRASWLLLVLVSACGASPAVVTADKPVLGGAAYFAGTFTTSTASYEAASSSTDAVRFVADGTFEHGTWHAQKRRFDPAPPSDRPFVKHWEIDESAHVISFALDGAEEHTPYVVDGPDRWKTVFQGDGETTTVYYLRR